jgi:phosphopantetheine adenylyltransferase
MYLLITRCLNNISVINDKLIKEKNAYVITNLKDTVNTLYEKIQVTWFKYSKKLTEMENKMGSIISDRFLKIFKSESIKEKDRFLVGIETSEYTKQEQIEFTEK